MSDISIRNLQRDYYYDDDDIRFYTNYLRRRREITTGLTFKNVCDWICSGLLEYTDFEISDIIELLESEVEPLPTPAGLQGDTLIRYLEQKYKAEPTKELLLTYALACQRYGLTPTLDFCNCA